MSGSDQINQPGKMEKEFNHSFHSFSLFLFSLFIQEFTKRKVLERALQIQAADTLPLAGPMQVMVYGSSVAMHPMVRTFPLLSFSLSSVPKKKRRSAEENSVKQEITTTSGNTTSRQQLGHGFLGLAMPINMVVKEKKKNETITKTEPFFPFFCLFDLQGSMELKALALPAQSLVHDIFQAHGMEQMENWCSLVAWVLQLQQAVSCFLSFFDFFLN
jgi:hypothetical protein